MLFVSHKLNTNTCGFCNQEFLKGKVDIFGYSSTNDAVLINKASLMRGDCDYIDFDKL